MTLSARRLRDFRRHREALSRLPLLAEARIPVDPEHHVERRATAHTGTVAGGPR